MTELSPINANLIKNNVLNKNQNKHDRVYENLIVQSSVVKPNKAKAALIDQKFPNVAKAAAQDIINDRKNFLKASATGHMDDHSLGRINDLGMKIGGLTIATFLASQAKTKTAAIMQYIGGGAFFASMALWPKLFINLPAKLVHGFRIDQKYTSAQGEKKDFFLDNQFLPWDAFPEEELRQNAVNAGIDYDSKNGDEKIKRKMQKTALQNRTLWMATAGFATPLMTSLFGDWIEPKVKNFIIKHDANKALEKINNVNSALKNSRPIVKNKKEIDTLFVNFKAGEMNASELFSRLSKLLSFDMAEIFNSPDDLKAVKNLKYTVDINELIELRNQVSTVKEDNLKEILIRAFKDKETATSRELEKQYGQDIEEIAENSIKQSTLNETMGTVTEEFKNSTVKNYSTLSNIVHNHLESLGLDKDVISRKLADSNLEFDDEEFIKQVKNYNENVLGGIRGRLKEYLKTIVNPVMGDRDESLYTDMYRKAMKNTLPQKRVKFRLPFYDKETIKMLKDVENANKQIIESTKDGVQLKAEILDPAIESVSQMFKRMALSDLYSKELEKLCIPKGDDIKEFAENVADDINLGQITSTLKEHTIGTPLSKSTNELQNWISRNIKDFVNVQEANNNAIRGKGLICANLERRIADKSFEQELESEGLISKEFPLEEWIKKARYMVYKGTVASDACSLELKNENLYRQFRNLVFDHKKFAAEKKLMPELEDVLNGLSNLKTTAKDNALVAGLANLEKTFVTEILNNQAWKKIFLPMSAALVAITLLVQPLFGNIKKDFPQDAKGGNK